MTFFIAAAYACPIAAIIAASLFPFRGPFSLHRLPFRRHVLRAHPPTNVFLPFFSEGLDFSTSLQRNETCRIGEGGLGLGSIGGFFSVLVERL